jgi:hypothetical protein
MESCARRKNSNTPNPSKGESFTYLMIGLARFHFTCIIWLFACAQIMAQQPVFKASVSSAVVHENAVFDVRFELSEAEGRNFQPPDFSDFKLVGGPARGSSTIIINGEVSRSENWSYSLLAHKTGKFTIGSAEVVAGNKKLASKPITIEVVKARDLPKGAIGANKEDIILIAEVPEQSFYPGQQIVLNYRLLFRENIQSVNVLSEDDYADFFVQPMTMFSKDPSTVQVNGKEYVSRIIKSMALFPHQSGTYTIDPMIMDVGINAPFPGIQGFFTMRRIQDVRITSKPITIRVQSLPSDAPATYQGAVGQYSMTAAGDNSDLTTDDAFTFYVEITGNGDSRRWDPPQLMPDSLLEAYEPKILEDLFEEKSTGIVHRRRIEYQVIPMKPGSYAIALPFSFFDPGRKQYTTLYSDTMHIKVAQGSGLALRRINADTTLQQAKLMKVSTPLLSDRFWTSWPHLTLLGLIISGALMGLLFARDNQRERVRLAKGRTTRDTVNDAVMQLDQLMQHDSPMTDKGFFEKCTEIYHRFLCERFAIPPAELDESRITSYVRQAGIDESLLQEILSLFHESLVVRYGGVPVGFSRMEMGERYSRVIKATMKP